MRGDKEELLSKLLEEYDVEESLAQQDIDAFLKKLIENGVNVPTEQPPELFFDEGVLEAPSEAKSLYIIFLISATVHTEFVPLYIFPLLP